MKKSFGTIDKAVPKNHKFDDVQSRIDTGLNANKVRTISAQEYLKRQDELFYRLSPTELMNLFAEYEVDGYEEVTENKGGWDGPRIVTVEAEEKPEYQRPYIIFDLRTPQEFSQCHILQARNHPSILLNQDKMSAEMYTFKNKEGQLIILYDNDTTIACQAAHTMCTRGFDNIYILSGGLYAFSERHPRYIEGDPPVRPASSQSKMGSSRGPGSARSSSRNGSKAGSRAGSRSGSARSASGRRMLSAAGSEIAGGGTRSIAGSRAAPPKVTGKIGSIRRGSQDSKQGLTTRSLASHSRGFKQTRHGDVESVTSKMTDMTVADSVIGAARARKGRM
mmetsp:Transcript_4014/g.5587  ORF Transcript_4014/g.5587 Transcript_4014/m.5587 type:complete len:335 (+) Transcript_4014:173-1177(+)